MTASLLDELRWRGMFHDATPGLEARLGAQPPISGYTGFDPSGPSLHIGHLVPIFGLLHLQQTGGRPVAVVGGGTGMIGDPSGRSAERNLLDPATLEANVASIGAQLGRLLDFEGPGAARLVNNADWLGGLGLIEFLRDVGKHFSIPYMLAKDSVQSRLERGLSREHLGRHLVFFEIAVRVAVVLHERGVELRGQAGFGYILEREIDLRFREVDAHGRRPPGDGRPERCID